MDDLTLPRGHMSTELERVRRARGLSREQLARAANVTGGALFRIEREGHTPRLPTAFALARVLGMSVEALFPEVAQQEASR